MVAYLAYRVLVWLFKITPFFILYRLSDFLRIILQYLIRYRRTTVEGNLKKCFPDLSQMELHRLVSESYKNLADIFLEGVKGLSLTKEELMRRYPMHGTEKLKSILETNQSIIIAAIHYANWEWGVLSFGYHFPGRAIGIYKPLSNHRIEEDLKRRRADSGMQLIPIQLTRTMEEEIEKGKLIIMMSDQNPSNSKDAIWVDFFGQDTACLHGLNKYSTRFQLPVYYCEINRLKRGYYETKFVEIASTPISENNTITQDYMGMLETTIRQYPPNWLWTHKRWKHQRNS
ncbi:MAG TPA: hypothetical protein PK006_09765 [Saprospiraceae bacterium]|nr:hypothetical protein [Saprospiraceae bacterium]